MRGLGRSLGCVLLALPAALAGAARLDPATVAAMLAGRYDNLPQVAAERRDGVAVPHEPLELAITQLHAPLVADVVLYVRESAADDPRRVFAQRIWVLGEDARHRVVHGVYRFAEPERWRGGASSPELFRALLARDLERVAGCDVRWSRTARGLRGANDPAQCRVAGAGGAALNVEQVLELDATTLAYSERALDAHGTSVRGHDPRSPYLFRRQLPPANRP